MLTGLLTRIDVELRPYYQVEADETPGYWRATGTDPQFLIFDGRNSMSLEAGHYYFEIISKDGLAGLVNPCFYVDCGRGLNAADRVALSLHRVANHKYRGYIAFTKTVRSIRFDPSETKTRFCIEAVRLKKVRRTYWYLSAAMTGFSILRSRGRRPRELFERLLQTWRSGGTTAVAAAVRRSLARPAGEPPALVEDAIFRNLYFNQSLITEGYRDPKFAAGRANSTDGSRCDVKLMAYYLPQFHPFPENDAWWGRGFTEWTNVTKALPRFEGHYQPKLPGDLGFYDLRNVDVMREQAKLAKQFGLTGFTFHFYWFGGKRLMETPLLNFRAAEDIDFQYSLCWANENWSRRWDGAEHELLIGQKHSPEDDLAFITYVARYFADKRYVKIDGRPMLTVYRPDILPDAKATAKRWRQRAKELGFPDIYLVATTSFGFNDYKRIGFDALSEFPPHAVVSPEASNIRLYDHRFNGKIYDYQSVVRTQLESSYPEGTVFPGIMPAWDNVARRPLAGHVFHNSTPEAYRKWLQFCVERARRNPEGERFVFINAWNEWAEGAYLEPDRLLGHAYLWATASVIDEQLQPLADLSNTIAAHNGRFVPQGDHAIVAHFFYPDVAADLAAQLPSGDAIDVYVSVPETIAPDDLAGIMRLYPRSFIMAVPNCGRDILPFLKLMPIVNRHPYTWICKLHGKKSVHMSHGNIWRSQIFAALLEGLETNGQAVKHNALPKDPRIGIVGPENSVNSLSDEVVIKNSAEAMRVLLERLGVKADIRKGSFVAGSMFWFRPAALQAIVDAKLDSADFGVELGRIDGTPAHAMERLFGLVAEKAGFAITEIKGKAVTVFTHHTSRASVSQNV